MSSDLNAGVLRATGWFNNRNNTSVLGKPIMSPVKIIPRALGLFK
jgi:hypothetical protein